MTGRAKILLPAAILIGGLALMLLFLSLGDGKSKREGRPVQKVVDTKVVTLSSTPARILGFGRVASAQPIQIFSEVSGTVMAGRIPFQPAQSFHKGDLLLSIDDRQATFALKSTKSDLLSALAGFLAEIKTNFPEELGTWQAYFDQCNFESALNELPPTRNQKIKLFLSRFNVYKLYYAVRDLEVTLSKHYVYAPFDGSIVTTNQRAGSTARAGTLLGEIVNLEDLEVEVPVAIQDVQWIDQKTPVSLSSSEIEGHWTGTITRVGQTVDSRTQSVQVFIALDDLAISPVLEGVFFQVTMSGLRVDHSVSIPRKALYDDEFVYLIKEGALSFRKVAIARKEQSSVIVNGGLDDGDTLVIEAMQGVYEGMSATSSAHATETGSPHE
jgi:membrane fusion protein (multidrug efflux system)